MQLKLTLVENREDRERYARVVSYEPVDSSKVSARTARLVGQNPAATGDVLRAVRREWAWVQDPQGRWRWQVVRVTELQRVPGRQAREWPRSIPESAPEPEELRRARVRALRKAIHVDPVKGSAEPDWDYAAALATSSKEKANTSQPATQGVISVTP